MYEEKIQTEREDETHMEKRYTQDKTHTEKRKGTYRREDIRRWEEGHTQ